jgi:hypothetical protein
MERELSDENMLSPETLNAMEAGRIDRLNEAGIDEKVVLQQANKHLNSWVSCFQENITRGKDDMNFVLRDQWTAVERSEFTRLFKPAMTFNKLYADTKKIAGEQRKNKPDLLVRSLTGRSTQEQINLRADLVRTISYQSQNDLVYQTAFKSALMLGYGAFQICLDYESPRSFNQIVRYDLIPDATRTVFDPKALKPHKGDGDYCGRYYVYSRDEFFATYPFVTNPVSYVDPYMLLDFQWMTRDTITVFDYFVKEWFPIIIYKLSNGMVVNEDDWPKMEKKFKEQLDLMDGTEARTIIEREIPYVVTKRQTQDYRVMHYRLIRDQIIDFSEWPSRQLPIVFVDGDSYYIEGRQYTKSFIHEARDAQKCVNYFNSEIAAEIKNRRREQWIGTPDNIIGYEQIWRNPEVQSGILMSKPDPKTGQLPQRSQPWDLSPQLMTNAQRATQDIREILGVSESDDLQGRDISGKARRERKIEGSMSAYIFFDNLNQAIEQGGRVVLDLLPVIAGEDERYMVISKPDGRTESIVLNQRDKDGGIRNQIEAGDYDIEIDTGPSFAVQKEIALEMFSQTLQAYPQAFPLIADLWAANLDIQWMPQIKERFKNLVPPEVLAKEEGKQAPSPKPNPQQMMMEAEMQGKMAQIQNKQAEIKIKQEELELKKQQAQLEQADLLLKLQKQQGDAQLNVYDHEANIERAKITHEFNKSKLDHDFTKEIAKILADLHKHETPKSFKDEMK